MATTPVPPKDEPVNQAAAKSVDNSAAAHAEPNTRPPPGKAVVSSKDQEKDPLELQRDRAREHHLRRYWTQLMLWGAYFLLAAVSYPIQTILFRAFESSCLKGSVKSGIACLFEPQLASVLGIYGFSLFLLLSSVIYHIVRYNDRMPEHWNLAVARAKDLTDIGTAATGYTDLYSQYIRTKRRSYHLMACGLLALMCDVTAIIAIFRHAVDASSILSSVLIIGLLVQALLGIVCLRLSYSIGSSYCPGPIIVDHTLYLATKTINPLAAESDQFERVRTSAAPFKNNFPWWWHPG